MFLTAAVILSASFYYLYHHLVLDIIFGDTLCFLKLVMHMLRP